MHTLPALFVIGSIAIILSAIFFTPYLMLLPAVYLLLLFFDAFIRTKRFAIAGLSVITSLIQLCGYGTGFIKSFIEKIILRRGLEDIETLKKAYK